MVVESVSVVPVLHHNVVWGHRQPVLSEHQVHSLVLLSQEQVPRLQDSISEQAQIHCKIAQ